MSEKEREEKINKEQKVVCILFTCSYLRRLLLLLLLSLDEVFGGRVLYQEAHANLVGYKKIADEREILSILDRASLERFRVWSRHNSFITRSMVVIPKS